MDNSIEIKRAIITGPTGAVGIALIEELISCGIEVIAVCRPGSRRQKNVPCSDLVHIVEFDIKDLCKLPSALSCNADAFYHLAWNGTSGKSRQDYRLQADNIRFSIDAVHAASKLGCQVFIGAGSQSEFGHVEGVLYPDLPCKPDNGYGAAKLAAADMTRLACKSIGIRHVWARIISLYGPFDAEYTLVSSCITSLLDNDSFDCTAGEQVWDYIYSKDSARAFRLLAEKGHDGKIYCVGTGNARKLKEFILEIAGQISSTAKINFGTIPYYENQAMHLEADISALRRDTGFEPRYSFTEGIRETIAWVNNERTQA